MRRLPNGDFEFLVRWRGKSSSHDKWEPEYNLAACQTMVNAFRQRQIEKVANTSTSNNNNNSLLNMSHSYDGSFDERPKSSSGISPSSRGDVSLSLSPTRHGSYASPTAVGARKRASLIASQQSSLLLPSNNSLGDDNDSVRTSMSMTNTSFVVEPRVRPGSAGGNRNNQVSNTNSSSISSRTPVAFTFDHSNGRPSTVAGSSGQSSSSIASLASSSAMSSSIATSSQSAPSSSLLNNNGVVTTKKDTTGHGGMGSVRESQEKMRSLLDYLDEVEASAATTQSETEQARFALIEAQRVHGQVVKSMPKTSSNSSGGSSKATINSSVTNLRSSMDNGAWNGDGTGTFTVHNANNNHNNNDVRDSLDFPVQIAAATLPVRRSPAGITSAVPISSNAGISNALPVAATVFDGVKAKLVELKSKLEEKEKQIKVLEEFIEALKKKDVENELNYSRELRNKLQGNLFCTWLMLLSFDLVIMQQNKRKNTKQ
jgi:hypothetical protein